ncbi:anti-sigma factor RsbA family regulatory protein [Streptosporangium sp. NPDC004379]|uniref:anti-sigma factor RsbA family regulatory protein n=1 Tax=Streptosporangium sp. NPDC004379 TaxID=3366189 RepID=UPI00368CC910
MDITGTHDTLTGSAKTPGLHHELYLYSGEAQFLSGALSFIEDALTADEVVLVSVPERRERILRAALPAPDPRVAFMDSSRLGRNPARLIPAWQRWTAEWAGRGRPVRGIGESGWDGRNAAETIELCYHEWLLNVAFTASPDWWLLCPCDTAAVGARTVREIARCHPFVLERGVHRGHAAYSADPFVWDELEPAPGPLEEIPYGPGDLAAVRDAVTSRAAPYGLRRERLKEVLVAVTEAAANSIVHGGGHGVLRVWTWRGTFVCEFRDEGVMADPMAGRRLPEAGSLGGRGLWLIHQLCDLVQIRSAPGTGTVIRLHIDLDPY